MTDITSRLLHWASLKPDCPAFQFASREAAIETQLTFSELAARASVVAAKLQARSSRGERAALLFSPGLDFTVAVMGCLLAGVIAVPMALPRREGTRDFADAIAENCSPRLVLTTPALMKRLHPALSQRPQWRGCSWLVVGDEASDLAALSGFTPWPGELAFLQYTSGSTSSPKGVMVSHLNLMSSLEMIQGSVGTSKSSTFACWLPLFHDMGLIGNVLHSVFVGATCILIAPLSFMQRPLAWLKVISEHRVDFAGSPNFGYDHCVDYLRARPDQALDLSSWRLAFNGAEPIRAATLNRFACAFAPFQFDRRAFYPCYGMAEATVQISGKTRRAGPVPESTHEGKQVVSCGSALPGVEIAVVDPESRRRLATGAVGEIWVRGPNISAGYWADPAATREAFNIRITDEDGGWLTTGDLGFLDERGELFVCGRVKDRIIVRGQNHYPQDIELSAREAHEAFHHQIGAAFVASSGRNEEALIVVQEVNRRLRHLASTEELETAIREAIALEHGLAVHKAVIVPQGTVPRTTSGKIRRAYARALWLAVGFTTADV